MADESGPSRARIPPDPSLFNEPAQAIRAQAQYDPLELVEVLMAKGMDKKRSAKANKPKLSAKEKKEKKQKKAEKKGL